MNKTMKRLLFIYFIIVLIKIIISYFVNSPSMYMDDYHYMKMARSFIMDHNFAIDGFQWLIYPPLYPMILSWTCLIKNTEVMFLLMKILNSILSTLIIFPAYALSKEFLAKKKALSVAMLVTMLPAVFAITPYILSENLFYPLAMLLFYLIYKSFTVHSLKYDILSGIILGIAYITRIIAIFFIPIILLLVLYTIVYYKDIRQIWQKVVLFAISGFIVLPWIIYEQFNKIPLVGKYVWTIEAISAGYYVKNIINWFIINNIYFILSTGIIFFIATLYLIINSKNKKEKILGFLALFSYIITILIITLYTSVGGRPMGRYMAFIFPLFFIVGAIAIRDHSISKKFMLKSVMIISLLFIFGYKLLAFKLFPVNNISLSFLGVLGEILSLLMGHVWIVALSLLLLILPIVALYIYKLRFLKIVQGFIILMFILSALNIAINIYNSDENWYKTEQTRLGLWINQHTKIDDVILLDERDYRGKIYEPLAEHMKSKKAIPQLNGKDIAIMNYWINAKIVIGDVNEQNFADYKYIVSTSQLDLNIVECATDGAIKIYVYESTSK